MRTLVWFRSDLRAGDQSALWHASHDSPRGVVGVFLLSPEQWRRHDMAPAKGEFLLRTLAELGLALAKLRIPLLVERAPLFADAPGVILSLMGRHACDRLFFNREYELDEWRRDERVEQEVARAGRVVRAFTDQVLIEPGDLRTQEGRWYTVFTPFKNAAIGRLNDIGVKTFPAPSPQPDTGILSTPIPRAIDGLSSTVDPELWPAGERAASARLSVFVSRHIHSYATARDDLARDATSTLSPDLAVGAISIRRCVVEARAAHRPGRGESPLGGGDVGVTTWISELLWREFFVHILRGFPRVCMHRAFRPATERVRWRESPEDLSAWREGRTGVPIVDAGMRQLLKTGWMHNRARMITAMFFSKNLLLDWRLGERHFMSHLVDGFLASNNGGWQWSASTGTDAAPYFRVFNPISQSRRFDPDGEYIARWVPELRGLDREQIHDPGELFRPRDYPAPIVDLRASRIRAIEAFRSIKT